MLKKILKGFTLILIIFFFFLVYEHYFSINENNLLDSNRIEIDKLVQNQKTNLPILKNNTDNVIEFNSGYEKILKKDNKKKFWNLFK